MDKTEIEKNKINSIERGLECQKFLKTKFCTQFFIPYLETKIERYRSITEVKGETNEQLLNKLLTNKARLGSYQNIISDLKTWSSIKITEGGEK